MKEKERITALLEKYWQAETTVEEERELAEFFRGEALPVEWEAYREVFGFFAAEAEVTPAEDLEQRILTAIHPPQQRTIYFPPIRFAWWAAAAVIILSIGLIPLFRSASPTVMKDTYDDPQQALAAVQKALFTVSRNLNKGLQPLK